MIVIATPPAAAQQAAPQMTGKPIRAIVIFLTLGFVLVVQGAPPWGPAAALAQSTTSKTVTVPADTLDFNTGISLVAGGQVSITATGTVKQCGDCPSMGPDGSSPCEPAPGWVAPALCVGVLWARLARVRTCRLVPP